MANDLISRQAAIDALSKAMPSLTTPDGCGELDHDIYIAQETVVDDMRIINDLPPAQPEYEPVEVEDFAKTMSENTLYSFMAWYGEALELMERHGFVICKKTM